MFHFLLFLSDPYPIITYPCHLLPNCCLVDLIDVTLACEEANIKLVDVVADENRIGNNLLKISEPRFGQKA